MEKVEKVEKLKSGEISWQKWRNLYIGYQARSKSPLHSYKEDNSKFVKCNLHLFAEEIDKLPETAFKKPITMLQYSRKLKPD